MGHSCVDCGQWEKGNRRSVRNIEAEFLLASKVLLREILAKVLGDMFIEIRMAFMGRWPKVCMWTLQDRNSRPEVLLVGHTHSWKPGFSTPRLFQLLQLFSTLRGEGHPPGLSWTTSQTWTQLSAYEDALAVRQEWLTVCSPEDSHPGTAARRRLSWEHTLTTDKLNGLLKPCIHAPIRYPPQQTRTPCWHRSCPKHLVQSHASVKSQEGWGNDWVLREAPYLKQGKQHSRRRSAPRSRKWCSP